MNYDALPDDAIDIKPGSLFTCVAKPDCEDRSYTLDLWRCQSRNETHIKATRLRADGSPFSGSLSGSCLIPVDPTKRKFVLADSMAPERQDDG